MKFWILSLFFPLLAMAEDRGCFEAGPARPAAFLAPGFASRHQSFSDYCSVEDDWARKEAAGDPLVARMREFASRKNICFVIVKGFGNELYGVPGAPALSWYLKESENVIQRLRSFDNRLGAYTPFTKPFEPEMASSQTTREAAIALLAEMRAYQPWWGSCDQFILHCHSKGGATCYNLGADDVLDSAPGNREWARDHVAMVMMESAVVSEGVPVADVALSYCEEDPACRVRLTDTADYALVESGRAERLALRQRWERFEIERSHANPSVLERLIFWLGDDAAQLVTRLTQGGLMSLTTTYVHQRRDLVRHSNNPLRDRFYYLTNHKDAADFAATNPHGVLAEFYEAIERPGDGLVPCDTQTDPEVGHWLTDTKNMWHMESNNASFISDSAPVCRRGYARQLWVNAMEQAWSNKAIQ